MWNLPKSLRINVVEVPQLDASIVEKYQNIMRFTVEAQHIYLQERRDSQNKWLTKQFKLVEEELDTIF